MGNTDEAIRVADKIYSFGLDNPFAKAEALKIYKRCGGSPPPAMRDTSVAKSQIQDLLKSLLDGDSWIDSEKLEKTLDHKFTAYSVNGSDAFGFDDRSEALIEFRHLRKYAMLVGLSTLPDP